MLKFSQLIVENSATSTASFKYFILQHQPLHSATSSALFSQRNCLFHPAKSNPSPNEVVSLTQRSRILNPAQSYPSILWNVWTCAMTYMKRKRLTWWLPGCFWNYVPTYLLLRRDVIFISSVGYDSSSHQPFRKEAVAEILCALIAIYHKRIVQSCHILLSFIIQTFIALFTQRKLRNKKRDRQMFSSFLIIIISQSYIYLKIIYRRKAHRNANVCTIYSLDLHQFLNKLMK